MKRPYRTALVPLLALALSPLAAQAETIRVRHADTVDITHHDCRDVTRSTVVRRTCYDARTGTMLVRLDATWYRYCGMPRSVATAWHRAPSMGRYFTREVRGRYTC